MVPDTDFPDIRVQSFVHSHEGTLFTIPREHDQIRMYIQQTLGSEAIDPETGRVDKNRTSPEKLLAEGQKIMKPYQIEPKDGEVAWWTIYIG